MAHPMQHYGERKSKFPMHEGTRPSRKIMRVETPAGTDMSFVYYECGCEGSGVGNSGSTDVSKCLVGHREVR